MVREYKIGEIAKLLQQKVLIGDGTHLINDSWDSYDYSIKLSTDFFCSITHRKKLGTTSVGTWSLNIGMCNCYDTYSLPNGADVVDIAWEICDLCNTYSKYWKDDGVTYNCGSLFIKQGGVDE